MYDVIVFATDGSDGTARAAEHAVRLAREQGATLHVLHVVDTATLPVDAPSRATLERLDAAGRSSVLEIRDRALEADVDTVDALRRGTPHREILRYAADADADLVVVGTHGRSGVRRVLLGSVAERVVRLSEVPVLTVRTLPGRE